MTEDPFVEYPDFGHILDQMAEKGLHLYYHRVRTTFKDEGTRWREKWEHRLHTWKEKARLWDAFSHIVDKGIISDEYLKDSKITLYDNKLRKMLEKIRMAFQARNDLNELQDWLLLNTKINYPPEFVEFIEKSLADWKSCKGHVISTPNFEVAPKGTIEQLGEVEHVLRFIEGTTPMGKMDGLPVHCSEAVEYVRLCLRSILGLSTDVEYLWSIRDVRKIYGWTRMGRKLGREGETRANQTVLRA